MPGAWDAFGPVKADLFRIISLSLVCLFVVRAVEWPGRFAMNLVKVPAVLPGLVLIIYGVLAMVFSLLGHGKPLAVLDLLLALGLFMMLVAENDRKLVWKMLAINAGAVGLASVYGLSQYFGFDWYSWRRGFAGSAPVSTYGNPLFLADGLASTLPFAVMGLLSSRRNVRFVSFMLSIVIFAGLLVTQGRGAWAGALIGLAVLFLFLRPEILAKKFWVGGWVLGALTIFSLAAFPGTIKSGGEPIFRKALVLVEQGQGGFRGRFLLWESTALMARENPIAGAGRGEFSGRYNVFQGPLLASPRYAGLEYHSTGHAHQDYLQMVAESGVVGLGLFFWMVVAVIVTVNRGALYQAGNSAGLMNSGLLSDQKLKIAALSGVVVYLVDAFFNGPLHLPPSAQWMWVLVAIACLKVREGASEGGDILPHRIPVYLVVLVIFASVLVARPFARDLAGEVYMKEANQALENNRPEFALERAIDSFALCVEDRRHRFLLGRAYYQLGRFGDSAEQFGLDAMGNPGMASAWHNLGLSLIQVGRSGMAVQAFRRAQFLDPTDKSLPGLISDAEKAVRRTK